MKYLITKKNNEKYSTGKRHLFDMLDLLVEKYDFNFIDYNLLLQKNINIYLEKTYNDTKFHILVLNGSSGIYFFKTNNNVKYSIIIDDLHTQGIEKKNRIKSLKKIDNVFATYGYIFNNYYPKLNYNLYWLPHSIRYLDIPFNNNPINKILISGRLNKNLYPNRCHIVSLSKTNKQLEYFKPNVGYRVNVLNENHICGKKYIEKLNQYICCFTDDACNERPYIVAKHFEILSSGSLLLACNLNTKKEFESLGFIDNEHYISCSKDNMIEKINYIFNNKKKIDRIRENGYKFALEKHNYKNRIQYLLNKLSIKN